MLTGLVLAIGCLQSDVTADACMSAGRPQETGNQLSKGTVLAYMLGTMLACMLGTEPEHFGNFDTIVDQSPVFLSAIPTRAVRCTLRVLDISVG